MKISALRMFNVKRFGGRGVAIENIGTGVNVLCAQNEFGKSTSFEALHTLFFQPHTSKGSEVRAIRPYSGGAPLIQADIATREGRFRITKQFLTGQSALVFDQDSGRLIAQADEAEDFIASIIRGGSGGPAGLLWVRQGATGIEKRNTKEEENEKQARAGLLESVQGEVEAVTGGRRMAEIMAAVSECCASLVTPTGRAKAGGRFFSAIEDRDRLDTDEKRLSREVKSLREALDLRSSALRRLNELEIPEDRIARRHAVEAAQLNLDNARAQNERLMTATVELDLARQRWDSANSEYQRFRNALELEAQLRTQLQVARQRRQDFADQRREITEAIDKARHEEEVAEADEARQRDLLEKLDAASKAADASHRLVQLEERLIQAEELRKAIEEAQAKFAQKSIPIGAIEELAEHDLEIAKVCALRDATLPSVTVAYDNGAGGMVSIAGAPLLDGEEKSFRDFAVLTVQGVGEITLRSNGMYQDDSHLEKIEGKRKSLLASMGVASLAAARAQQEQARQFEVESREGLARLALLAPNGLPSLREELVALRTTATKVDEIYADPAQVRIKLDQAIQQRKQANQRLRQAEQLRENFQNLLVQAETDLARLQTESSQIETILGPEDTRIERARELSDRLEPLRTALTAAEGKMAELEAASVELDNAEAFLRRAQSAEQAAEAEISQLRETLAELNGQIRTRSDDAIEEQWQETKDALEVAQDRVNAYEEEVAILQRLSLALESARSQARDLYLKPVMNELKPLLGLLFDDVSVTFDDKTLLPRSIRRNGLEEDIERLSGGMREQVSVLTRLAFARLLAHDGRAAPVILDDALVYSDDDRIEKMFDALHRQARDQQIIVFSCRQRAFQKLGGNVLRMTDWQP